MIELVLGSHDIENVTFVARDGNYRGITIHDISCIYYKKSTLMISHDSLSHLYSLIVNQ